MRFTEACSRLTGIPFLNATSPQILFLDEILAIPSADLVNSNIKNAVAIENLTLTGNYVATLTCPTGWIKVPGDSAYGTGDFCVMKYEAKNISTVATSQAASTPWTSITQTASITACRALGTGYDLIRCGFVGPSP